MDFIMYTNFVIFFMVLVFISCVESGGKEGLIFDRFSGSLIQLPNEVPKEARCGAWAIACPASLSEGEQLMKNALIVKKIYNVANKVAEMDIKLCEETYKATMKFDVAKMIFRFGFAIYHKEYFPRSDFKRYISPEEIKELMKKHSISKGKIIGGELFQRMNDAEKEIPNRKDELWVNNDYKMEFMWIKLFNLNWDFFNKILTRIVYKIDSNYKWSVGERCEDYNMGSEVYDEKDVNYVDKLYSDDNQNKIFKNVKIPGKKCDPVSGQCPMKTQCDLNKICLSKWLLIPMHQFTFGTSTSSLTCSNLATIPIWTDTVEKVLKKVDQYLYALYRITRETLLINSGITKDILELPLARRWFKRSSKIYLDPINQKIPVPKIIFKIINYFDPDLYSAIIVIHNSPYYNGRRLCKEDITTKGGWEEITKDSNGNDFGNVYVCKSDDDILNKLLGRSTVMKHIPSSELNLYSFPSRTTSGQNTRNIKEDVDNAFKTFSEKGAYQNPGDEILERPASFMSYVEGEGDGDVGDGDVDNQLKSFTGRGADQNPRDGILEGPGSSMNYEGNEGAGEEDQM